MKTIEELRREFEEECKKIQAMQTEKEWEDYKRTSPYYPNWVRLFKFIEGIKEEAQKKRP